MKPRSGTYTTCSIALVAAWVVVLILAFALDSSDTFHDVVILFAGFLIGWLAATIARSVYPPPKKYRQNALPG
jgi:threonine/homoserine/homoserine lactone efflux protein